MVKSDISSRAIRLIAEECVKAAYINPDIVIAEVVGDNYVFGMVRMSHILRSPGGWEENVFRNRTDAEAWIRARVKDKFGLTDISFE